MIIACSTPSAVCECDMNPVTCVKANTNTRSKSSSNVVTRWVSFDTLGRGKKRRVEVMTTG